MDVLTVKSLNFLSKISMNYIIGPRNMSRNQLHPYQGCMDKLLAVYKRGGFNITEIHFDDEFLKVMDPF